MKTSFVYSKYWANKFVNYEPLAVRSVLPSILTAIAMVTLQTFYLGKLDLLTVYQGKLYFLSVTDFSPGNLPSGDFCLLGLGYVSGTKEFPLTATPKR